MPVWPILGDVFNDLSPPSSPDSNSERHPNSLLTVPDIDRNGCLATWNPINVSSIATPFILPTPQRSLVFVFPGSAFNCLLGCLTTLELWTSYTIQFGDFQTLCSQVPSYTWSNLFCRQLQTNDARVLTGLSQFAASAWRFDSLHWEAQSSSGPTDVLRLLTLPFQSTTSGSSLIQGSAALVWLTAIEAGLVARLSDGLPNNAQKKSLAHNFIKWDSLTAQAAQNMDVLSNLDNIKILSNVLKTNVSACASIGSFYLPQVGRVMLGLYKAVSGIISETVAREANPQSLGTIATKTPKIRRLRTVKKEILKLMERYIKKAEDLDIQIYIYM
ncbi:uncharacterized protein HD556DRAFT_1315047 [Suillus plorans]|uniref:Exportin-1 C-terminal domain-containing protein n=1 Tax=Suillus plorans TaxID=116603 RepID=A0A9P7A8W2_9AGAM|nr:uncharacterized protein HD556DRAFT_1315047 [Suillus plorans]KAG1784476.1 hypothetical protein HD556DRAFT_1315047 [Suillus plorans]